MRSTLETRHPVPSPRAIQSILSNRQELVAALLLLCGAAFYLPNVNSYFLADDFVLLSWTHVSSIGEVAGFFDPRTTWFYRPVVKVVYWAGQSIFGLHAAPFHLFSLVLHWSNAYLVYQLVRRQARARRVMSIVAGLVFALYPAHAETVSWIAAVGDLIAVFCILAALICYESFCEDGRVGYLGASLGLFAVGLLSRESVVMLPALVLLDALVFGRWRMLSVRRVVLVTVAYMAVLAGYLAIQAAGRDALPPSLAGQSPQLRMLNLDSILLGIMDYVHRLVPGGDMLARQPLDVLRVLVWVEWAMVILLALWLWRSGRRLMLFGLGWVLVTPLAFVFFSSSPTDRYMYLVSVGYAVFVAGLFDFGFWILDFGIRYAKIQNPKSKILKVGVVMILMALLVWQGVQLVGRESAWRSAGKITGGVFHDMRQAVPEPRDYTAFYFVDLPMWLDGVPVFVNALPLGVQRIYDNDTLAASAVSCSELQQVELPRYSFMFRYKGDGVRQLTSVQECR